MKILQISSPEICPNAPNAPNAPGAFFLTPRSMPKCPNAPSVGPLQHVMDDSLEVWTLSIMMLGFGMHAGSPNLLSPNFKISRHHMPAATQIAI